MSKKSFKQLQNRLYREIKRRIQAESMPINNRLEVTRRPIDRLAYTSSIPLCGVDDVLEVEKIAKYLMRTDIAKVLADELITSQYVKREIYVEPDAYGQDILYVRCIIDVCNWQRGA